VMTTLIPVILVAFLSIPYSLGHHPGEVRAPVPATLPHMT
jgi:hypothetical protein